MLKSTIFTFDGIPSDAYGLMIYFTDDAAERDLSLGTNVSVIEDRLPKRTTPIHYGVNVNEQMTFPLTFGSMDYLTDDDVDAILSWLTGHQQYKWLEFLDGDHYVRYKCHLNDMQSVHYNGLPVAFTCNVECDGQFAYEYPASISYAVDAEGIEVNFYNKSSYNGYLYPELELNFGDECNSLSIINESDNNREFKINTFDRTEEANSTEEIITSTSLSEQIADDSDSNDFVAWDYITLSDEGYFGEIIYGNDHLVALPVDGNIVMWSSDEGVTWNAATLPSSGSWTGCYGDAGFVAITTDPDIHVSAYSQTGEEWLSTMSAYLTTEQTYSFVRYVNVKNSGYYLAISAGSSRMMKSSTGRGWVEIAMPEILDWSDVISDGSKCLFVASNVAKAYTSAELLDHTQHPWAEITLPVSDTWSTACYDDVSYYIVSNSGSGISLQSDDAASWEIVSFPVGEWSQMLYDGDTGYMLRAGKKYAYSTSGNDWVTGTFKYAVTSVCCMNKSYYCATGSNAYYRSENGSKVSGFFTVDLPELDEGSSFANVSVLAQMNNTAGDFTYEGLSEPIILAESVLNSDGSRTQTGGTVAVITTDKRKQVARDGVQMSATIDVNGGFALVKFSSDNSQDNIAVLNAQLDITIRYELIVAESLELDGLVINIDNKNQIITTNKSNFNAYNYFNRKFFRLLKGDNKLKLQTDAGECGVTINYEFLRKVGGR